MSITARFLVGFALILCAGSYVLFAQLVKRVERQYMEAAEEPMVDVANILAEHLAAEAKNGVLDAAMVAAAVERAKERKLGAQIYHSLKTGVDMDVYVTDTERRVLADSSGIERPGSIVNHRDVTLTLNGQYGARASRVSRTDPLSVVMYVGAPIIADGRVIGMISVAKPQRSLLAFMHETQRWLRWLVLTLVAAMVAGAYLAARWATRPLQDLTRHALAVSRGERPPPPHMPGHQMKTLGSALESMRDALEGREYVESYVQSLTHELKSPVAAIVGASEILQGDVAEPKRSRFLNNIRMEADRLRDLLERLLRLAALEKQKRLDTIESVDIRSLIDRSWDHVASVAAAKEVRLQHEFDGEGLKVEGDPWLLELALGNLLQNAIDFAPRGTAIVARAFRFNGRVVVEFEDAGPGIPEYAQNRVFERFYSLPRPETGKKSTGLGLCFVREVAQLHGGSVELLPVEGGSGTRAVLLLN